VGNQYNKHTIGDLFDLVIENESKSEKLYQQFAELFSSYPDITKFWKSMAADETTHISLINQILRSLGNDYLRKTADPEEWNRATKTRNFLNSLDIQLINNLNDAFELAHELEYSEINTSFVYMTTELEYTEEKRDSIMARLLGHQKKIMSMKEKFGNPENRKRIAVERKTEITQ